MVRVLFAASLGLLLSACSGQHVQFAHPAAFADPPGETRIFLDDQGDLYPRTGLSADFLVTKANRGSLFDTARAKSAGLCDNPAPETELAQLCTAIGPDCNVDLKACFNRWQHIQAKMWASRSADINGAIGATDPKDTTLAVLIHGFNNDFSKSQATFALAQKQMRRFAPEGHRLHFVEVYWDGCTNSTGIGCWGRAQYAGPLAGFALRQMMHGVEERWSVGMAQSATRGTLHWRMLTHSSGAFVAGAIFANPGKVLPRLDKPGSDLWYARFKKHGKSTQQPFGIPKLKNFKLGMFAAATTYQTFEPTPEGQGLPDHPIGILISVQGYDGVLAKRGLGCRKPGATCLGLRAEQSNKLAATLEATNSSVRLRRYDFTRTAPEWASEKKSHDFAIYLRQAADNTSFLRDLMDPRLDHPGNGRTP